MDSLFSFHFSVETFQAHRTDGHTYDNPLVANGLAPNGTRYGDPVLNQQNDPLKMWHFIIPHGLITNQESRHWRDNQHNPIVHRANYPPANIDLQGAHPGGFPSVNALLRPPATSVNNIYYYHYGNAPGNTPALRLAELFQTTTCLVARSFVRLLDHNSYCRLPEIPHALESPTWGFYYLGKFPTQVPDADLTPNIG